MGIYALYVFFKVVKHFEFPKVLYKFPMIIIIIFNFLYYNLLLLAVALSNCLVWVNEWHMLSGFLYSQTSQTHSQVRFVISIGTLCSHRCKGLRGSSEELDAPVRLSHQTSRQTDTWSL